MEKRIFVIFKYLLIVTAIMPLSNLFGAVPSMEGLFRNGSNADISSEVIVFRFQVEEVENEMVTEQIKVEGNDEKLKDSLTRIKMPAKFIEMVIFPVKSDNKVKMIYNEYADATYSSSMLIRSILHNNFKDKIDSDGYPARNLLFSSLLMYALNDSSEIVSFIKFYNSDFQTNKEIMSKEKVSLLRRFEKYLVDTKEDKELAEAIESPMNPADENQRATVQEVKSSRMYKIQPNVKLIKDGTEFYWSIALDKMTARFTNEKHHLEYLKMNITDGILKLTASDYMLFGGSYLMPKYLMIKDINERLFKITVNKLTHYSKSSKSDSDRHKDFLETIKKNGNSDAQVEPASTDLIY